MIDSIDQTERYPWRLFWVLFAAGIFGALAIIPLAMDLFGLMLSKVGKQALTLPLLIVGVVQNLVLLGLIIGIGLKLSRRLGLGTPLIESWIYRGRRPLETRGLLKDGLLTGTSVGLVLLGTLLVLAPRLPGLPFVAAAKLALWKRFLACFSGGLYEELLTRLFLLALIAWIANRSWRKPPGQLSSTAFWIANLLVAILFGLSHLPSASLVMKITPLVVVVAILLNGIAAVSFGYLYRKWGLEAAMVAHFTADFVIYVMGPFLLKT